MQSDYADLHLHTIYSDGFSTPQKMVEMAKECGLKCIAFTDHDSVEGVEEGLLAGERNGIEVIPAVEISATEENEDIHILGYFIDWRDEKLQRKMADIQIQRKERMLGMIRKLNGLGVEIDEEHFFQYTGNKFLGRLKLAHYLVKEGWVSSLYEAFNRYIGNTKPAYQEIDAMNPKEAIEIILQAKGIPVFAHPGLAKKDHLIPGMVANGLRGLEIFYYVHTEEDIKRYLELTEKYNLLITGGSDCHGNSQSGILMGKTKLPMIYVEKLKEEAKIR
jgi:predicted metal-dependent phosphoesterase TrpH